jgi:hypothetical protein
MDFLKFVKLFNNFNYLEIVPYPFKTPIYRVLKPLTSI